MGCPLLHVIFYADLPQFVSHDFRLSREPLPPIRARSLRFVAGQSKSAGCFTAFCSRCHSCWAKSSGRSYTDTGEWAGLRIFVNRVKTARMGTRVAQHHALIRWDEKAGLRTGCGVRSQVIDVLEAQEIKETGNEED